MAEVLIKYEISQILQTNCIRLQYTSIVLHKHIVHFLFLKRPPIRTMSTNQDKTSSSRNTVSANLTLSTLVSAASNTGGGFVPAHRRSSSSDRILMRQRCLEVIEAALDLVKEDLFNDDDGLLFDEDQDSISS